MGRYRARVSGPLLDRIDLHVEVPAVPFSDLSRQERGEPSSRVGARVAAARAVQERRYAGLRGVGANAHLGPGGPGRRHRPSAAVVAVLQQAVDGLGLSARAYHRVLRVARTIADLEGTADVDAGAVLEAVQYRVLDRRVV